MRPPHRRTPPSRRAHHAPDTHPTTGRAQPRSAPPWNPQAAAAYFDAHATIRDTLAVFQLFVHGHTRPRSWTHTSTLKALVAITRLAEAVPPDHANQAARDLERCVTAILQLPAIDEVERPRRIPWACRYCGFEMVWVYPLEGKVTCLRYGACYDSNDVHPVGFLGRRSWTAPRGSTGTTASSHETPAT